MHARGLTSAGLGLIALAGSASALTPLECREGVLYHQGGGEAALWGVNFQTPVSWEYKNFFRHDGTPLTAEALNQLTDQNLDDLVLMGVRIVRVHLSPSDFTDAEGHLQDSPYLAALDHLLRRCREKEIYAYLALINHQHVLHFTNSFMAAYRREQWLFDTGFVTRAERYVGELLTHTNRYTGTPLAQDPALGVIEIINEPAYPATAAFAGGQADLPERYWDFPADLSTNNYLPYLHQVWSREDELGWLKSDLFKGKAKLVYEFETMFNTSAHMYPAMAALFRGLGAQVACMWHYRLRSAAQWSGGSHYLNLYCTPRKALSFKVAGRVFADTPRGQPFPAGDDVVTGSHWSASHARDVAVYRTEDSFLYSGPVDEPADEMTVPYEVAGWGTSSLIGYEGSGAYFMRVESNALDITILPDAAFSRPSWVRSRPRHETSGPLCMLETGTTHRLSLKVDGWTNAITCWRVNDGQRQAVPISGPGLSFPVTPGRYRMERAPPPPRGTRPLNPRP